MTQRPVTLANIVRGHASLEIDGFERLGVGPVAGAVQRGAVGTVRVFFQTWTSCVPLPLTTADGQCDCWQQLAMLQVEVSRTMVFDGLARSGPCQNSYWSATPLLLHRGGTTAVGLCRLGSAAIATVTFLKPQSRGLQHSLGGRQALAGAELGGLVLEPVLKLAMLLSLFMRHDTIAIVCRPMPLGGTAWAAVLSRLLQLAAQTLPGCDA